MLFHESIGKLTTMGLRKAALHGQDSGMMIVVCNIELDCEYRQERPYGCFSQS
jgi:hypothetical protein